MQGITFVESVDVNATSGQMLLTLQSGGDSFRFHLSPHVALVLRETIMRDGWQVLCAPDADVVALRRAPAKRRPSREGR